MLFHSIVGVGNTRWGRWGIQVPSGESDPTNRPSGGKKWGASPKNARDDVVMMNSFFRKQHRFRHRRGAPSPIQYWDRQLGRSANRSATGVGPFSRRASITAVSSLNAMHPKHLSN
jgi:hypothetical protein